MVDGESTIMAMDVLVRAWMAGRAAPPRQQTAHVPSAARCDDDDVLAGVVEGLRLCSDPTSKPLTFPPRTYSSALIWTVDAVECIRNQAHTTAETLALSRNATGREVTSEVARLADKLDDYLAHAGRSLMDVEPVLNEETTDTPSYVHFPCHDNEEGSDQEDLARVDRLLGDGPVHGNEMMEQGAPSVAHRIDESDPEHDGTR